MFFLLRAVAVIALIFHFSPVREGAGERAVALDVEAMQETVAHVLDDPRYDAWSVVPQYARDRLALEIARQLADAALGPAAEPGARTE